MHLWTFSLARFQQVVFLLLCFVYFSQKAAEQYNKCNAFYEQQLAFSMFIDLQYNLHIS